METLQLVLTVLRRLLLGLGWLGLLGPVLPSVRESPEISVGVLRLHFRRGKKDFQARSLPSIKARLFPGRVIGAFLISTFILPIFQTATVLVRSFVPAKD